MQSVLSTGSSMDTQSCNASLLLSDTVRLRFTSQSCPSCWRRCAFGQRRALSRSKRQQQANSLRCSGSIELREPNFASLGSRRTARPVTRLRSASVRTATTASRPVPGGRDFFAWLLDLPWNRVGVWVVVAWFFYQLKDFFGVRCSNVPCALGCLRKQRHGECITTPPMHGSQYSFSMMSTDKASSSLVSASTNSWLSRFLQAYQPHTMDVILLHAVQVCVLAESGRLNECTRHASMADTDSLFVQIAMGTFVLSFIGNGFVRSAQRTMPLPAAIPPGMRRKFLVLLYFTAIVSCVTLFGVMTIPDIIREAADFVSRLQSDSIWVVVLEKLRHGLGYAHSSNMSHTWSVPYVSIVLLPHHGEVARLLGVMLVLEMCSAKPAG